MYKRSSTWLTILALALCACEDKKPTVDGAPAEADPPTEEATPAAATKPEANPKGEPSKEETEEKEETAKGADAHEGMVEVPAGAFKMSKVKNTPLGPEPGELVEVELPTYLIDAHEVTVAEYRACVEAGECKKPLKTHEDWRTHNWGAEGRDDHPINGVSWAQARTYCEWAGKRLPTEAEWEKAARGTDARIYPWGKKDPTCALAVFKEGDEPGCGEETTQPVGSRAEGASPYGAHDMVGNVSEWVADYTDLAPEPAPVDRNKNVHRGGNFLSPEMNLQVTQRFYVLPETGGSVTGMRCAKSPKT